MNNDWISELKPGDKVVVGHGTWMRSEERIVAVKRTTERQIITAGGCDCFGKWHTNNEGVYQKETGQGMPKVGDVINRLIEFCTPEIEAEFKEREKRKWLIANIRQLADMSAIQNLTTEQLETINGWLSK